MTNRLLSGGLAILGTWCISLIVPLTPGEMAILGIVYFYGLLNDQDR